MRQLGQHAPPRHAVAHLSDPHLLGPGELHLGVIDNEADLRRAMERLAAVRPAPAALVLTGDLADRAGLVHDLPVHHLRNPCDCCSCVTARPTPTSPASSTPPTPAWT